MSVIVESSKLVLKHLQEMFPALTCRRSYDPVSAIDSLANFGQPEILVVPTERDAEKFTNGGMQKNTLVFDIAVLAHLRSRNDEPEDLLAEIDGYVEIAETIHSAFLKKIVKEASGLRLVCQDPNHVCFNDYEFLRDRNCFMSVIEINSEVFTTPQ